MFAGVLCASAQTGSRAPVIENSNDHEKLRFFRSPYQAKKATPSDEQNSPRIYELLRANNIYLSLSDAIALAIENNLDVQAARYQLPIAGTDVLRSKGGGTLRGIPLQTTELPAGVGGPASPLLTTPATGTVQGISVSSNVYDLSLFSTTSVPISLDPSSLSSPLPSATGPTIPQYDPLISGTLGWTSQTTPQSNTVGTGTPVLQQKMLSGSLTLQQGFSTGTQYSLGWMNSSQSSNSTQSSLNPTNSGSLGLTVTQPLLRGFGITMNRRFIRIAKNDQKISQMVFRQEVINVIYGVSRLYFDLAGLYEDVHVKRDTLRTAQSLYSDTKAKVEEGTLADVELTRAEAEVAGAEQDVINSEGLYEEQEAVMKNVLTRRSLDPAIQSAHFVPTDVLAVPPTEDIPAIADVIPKLANRPDLQQASIELANSRIAIEGARNALLPQLNLVGTIQNSGLSGQPNSLENMSGSTGSGPTMTTSGPSAAPDPSMIGGAGNTTEQILTHKYPTYEIGLNLTFPIRNRVAQADMERDLLSLRSYQVRFQQLQNQAQLEAEDAVIALRRSRAAYDAAFRTRVLQAQSLDVERAKYDVGVSTASLVIQYQSYLAQAQSTELVAKGNYFKARAALERALGTSLEAQNITFEEAYNGRVSRPSSPVAKPVP
jgi:outer membrane protein TolC